MKARKKRLSKSTRKFIRREKARIRSRVFDLEEEKKQIVEIYQKLSTVKKNKSEISSAAIKEKKSKHEN